MKLNFPKSHLSEPLGPYPPQERVEVIRRLRELAAEDPFVFEDDYQLGIANGLILALSIMEGRQPILIAKKFQAYYRGHEYDEFGTDREIRDYCIAKAEMEMEELSKQINERRAKVS